MGDPGAEEHFQGVALTRGKMTTREDEATADTIVVIHSVWHIECVAWFMEDGCSLVGLVALDLEIPGGAKSKCGKPRAFCPSGLVIFMESNAIITMFVFN